MAAPPGWGFEPRYADPETAYLSSSIKAFKFNSLQSRHEADTLILRAGRERSKIVTKPKVFPRISIVFSVTSVTALNWPLANRWTGS